MKLILYTKPNCSLCDELKADLLSIEQYSGLSFTLEERNIEDNTQHLKRFQYLIPVLDIENGPTLYPPHTWHSLYRQLIVDN